MHGSVKIITMEKQKDENKLTETLRQLYGNGLSQEEAAESAHNLVGLFEVLLDIHKEKENAHVPYRRSADYLH